MKRTRCTPTLTPLEGYLTKVTQIQMSEYWYICKCIGVCVVVLPTHTHYSLVSLSLAACRKAINFELLYVSLASFAVNSIRL